MIGFSLNKLESNYKEIEIDYKKAKEGDVHEKDKLIKKFIRMAKDIAKNNGEIDEDLLQELLILLINKAIDTYNINSNTTFSTYYCKLANNHKNNYYKSENIRNHFSLNKKTVDDENKNKEYLDLIEDEDIDIENNLIQREINKVINNIINNNLKERYKKIIELHYGFNDYKKHSCREIANKIGVSRQVIYKQLNKVEELIKERLIWEGWID